MSFVELVILGMALAMDAFAITISNMFGYKGLTKRHMALMVLFFGVFQGLMPLIGFFAASIVSETITQFAGIITFAILGFIGGKMIWDVFHEEEDEEHKEAAPTLAVLFFQAIATSIDALAVGVSFAALSVNVVSAAAIITVTTALCCCVALLIGKKFGAVLGERATLVGGVVLILIGLKALIF